MCIKYLWKSRQEVDNSGCFWRVVTGLQVGWLSTVYLFCAFWILSQLNLLPITKDINKIKRNNKHLSRNENKCRNAFWAVYVSWVHKMSLAWSISGPPFWLTHKRTSSGLARNPQICQSAPVLLFPLLWQYSPGGLLQGVSSGVLGLRLSQTYKWLTPLPTTTLLLSLLTQDAK